MAEWFSTKNGEFFQLKNAVPSGDCFHHTPLLSWFFIVHQMVTHVVLKIQIVGL